MSVVRKREPWRRFAVKAAMAGVLAATAGTYLCNRFAIAIDAQHERSMPDTRILLIDRFDRTPRKGRAYAFPSLGLSPWIKDGQLIAKFADGVPGDHVVVSKRDVRINGHPVVEGLALAATLGQPPERYEKDFTVPTGEIFMLGRAYNSFDSRYWGPVPETRIIGRAYPIF